jgi:hypothetical protein
MSMDLVLIDAIGPFFRGYDKRRINWSKIPFEHLPLTGVEREERWQVIREEMAVFADRAMALGCNAVTLDDVAHVTLHPWYEEEAVAMITVLREEFRKIVALLREKGLRVYFTTDFVTTTQAIDLRVGNDVEALSAFFQEVVTRFLDDFSEVEGVILRIGESDGQDVAGVLRSRLVLRSAEQTNRLLLRLLPEFEKKNRKLIFRTWTVGSYLIGDLIWHRGRMAQLLDGVDSPAFLISMKYGESDFFRYLPLNRHFFRTNHAKIIEFQARPEYEGAGEYPSYMGWNCERYARELHGATNVVGLSVWCQTGGWHAFRRLTFLDKNAVWAELNVHAIVKIMRHGWTVEQCLDDWFGRDKSLRANEFLRRCDSVVRRLLYVEEFARQKLFFRRVRIPPLLHVYWDNLFINEAVRTVMTNFVLDPEAALREGEAAFAHFQHLPGLAEEIGLPVDDVLFMQDTFYLILLARRYYLLPEDAALREEILNAKAAYKERWPRPLRQRYRIRVSFEPFHVKRRTMQWVGRLLIRRQRGYRRLMDRVFTLNVLSWIYKFFRNRHQEAVPKFLRKSAMGVDSLFH